jgi:hypothetical protein
MHAAKTAGKPGRKSPLTAYVDFHILPPRIGEPIWNQEIHSEPVLGRANTIEQTTWMGLHWDCRVPAAVLRAAKRFPLAWMPTGRFVSHKARAAIDAPQPRASRPPKASNRSR